VRLPWSGWFFVSSLLLALTACGGGGSSGSSNTPPPPPKQAQLAVTLAGSGNVTSSPAGINCPSTCTASFTSGTDVTLTATAASGSNFTGFGGACSGPACALVLASNESVSATFTAVTPGSAQLTVAVSGSGTVTSNPSGINCPSACTATFHSGMNITLSATAASGFDFAGFTGPCSGMTCQLDLSSGQNVNVSASFEGNITRVKHVIVMLQENRAFDHYFGHLPQYWQAHGFPQASNGTTFDGEPANASNVDPNAGAITAYNMQSACTENPSPSWSESHIDRNWLNPSDPNTAPMDGFVRTAAGDAGGGTLYDVLGHRAIGYFVGDNQLDYYYFMASSFATSDRWFSPVMTRTHPNRMYLYAATSAGHAYPLPHSNSQPLTNQTIFQLLQNNNISWKIYIHPDTTGCSTPGCLYGYSYLTQFAYAQFVITNMPNHFASTAQLMTDIQNGTLPQVSFIEPAGYVGLDEHPTGTDVTNAPNVQAGAHYVQSIIDGLMASPSWKDTAFILSYDEGGGFYDHVPPQPATPPDSIDYPTDLASNDVCVNNTSTACGFFFTGFRVPLIVISPFTKKNYVSHTVMDLTAILKFIETRFDLPSLTARDAAQPDMTEFFDFDAVPWATPPNPPQQPQNMPCILEALSAVTISPNPAPAGGQATVTVQLIKNAIQNTTVALTSNPSGLLPSSTVIATGSSSTALTISVPTGINALTVTGSVEGIPQAVTVPVQ
jgi:phospholipase C